jgi:hypothetical protein
MNYFQVLQSKNFDKKKSRTLQQMMEGADIIKLEETCTIFLIYL